MRCSGLLALGVTALSALPCLSVPARADLVVKISKAQQRLEVVVNGTEAYRWPVSTGRRGYQTPSGTYRPIRLERHWYSRKYHMTPMPYSVFFYRGYAVHGTMESRNLGRAVSHGCVRLRPDNASILFSLVRRHGARNTRLVVMNGPLPQPPRAPQGVPMAETPAQPQANDRNRAHLTEAVGDQGEQHLSAKAHDAARTIARANRDEDATRSVRPPARAHFAGIERASFARSDEARVLREREAWLRSLDRKYGITR